MASIQFSDTTNNTGIIQQFEFNCGLAFGDISGNTVKLKAATNLANWANSEVWHLLNANSAGIKYDDSNFANLAPQTVTLTDQVSKVALPSGMANLDRIEVVDNNGIYWKVAPLVLEDIKGALPEFLKTAGLPLFYRPISQSTIELFPKPSSANVTLSNGLKVYPTRGTSAFTYTDTTKSPGFFDEYHYLIPLKMSIKWLSVNKPDSRSLQLYLNEEAKGEAQLIEFIQQRFRDRKPLTLRARKTNAR